RTLRTRPCFWRVRFRHSLRASTCWSTARSAGGGISEAQPSHCGRVDELGSAQMRVAWAAIEDMIADLNGADILVLPTRFDRSRREIHRATGGVVQMLFTRQNARRQGLGLAPRFGRLFGSA